MSLLDYLEPPSREPAVTSTFRLHIHESAQLVDAIRDELRELFTEIEVARTYNTSGGVLTIAARTALHETIENAAVGLIRGDTRRESAVTPQFLLEITGFAQLIDAIRDRLREQFAGRIDMRYVYNTSGGIFVIKTSTALHPAIERTAMNMIRQDAESRVIPLDQSVPLSDQLKLPA